tara:strand:- start:3883 stop:8544 length:4662 start_codon:yes stop_codon:yes gene_type:complete
MAELTNNFLKGTMNKDLDESLVPNGSYRDALNVDIIHSEGDDAGTVRNKKGNTQLGDLNNVTGQILSVSTAATATIVGAASLNNANGTSLVLENTDGSTVTFTTDPTLNFGDVSASIGDHTWRINTKDISGGDEVRKATQAIHIAVLAAIAAGELDMTVVPATNTGTQTEFTLTQNNDGTIGNTPITLMTGATGASSFTGGLDNTQNARTIGAVTFESDNLIYYLVASDKLDGVFEYNEKTNKITRVLQSNKASAATASKLNFNQNYYVTGINYVDGFLYWTDNFNPPRRINISRAKGYDIDDDRIDDDISVILEPPLNAPMIDMIATGNQENNLQETFVQFSYRFKYVDNQYSAMSPFSGAAFIPSTYVLDFAIGENKGMLNSHNAVDISFETGNQFVEKVEVLMRDTKSTVISVVESFDKEALSIPSNNVHTYRFSNNKTYRTLPSNQLGRLFDNVPLKAKAQSFIDTRIVYGNYEQSFDMTDSLGVKVIPDYSVKYVSKETPTGEGIQTFRSDRDYEIGIQYGDKYGRFTTVLTAPENDASPTVYIPPSQSITGNSLSVEINNKPPDFATCYRLVIKQNKGIYYNIFPVKFYKLGMFRYFKINDFDRDKVRVGDYIIFKSTSNGPTLTNKKYKVLEVEVQTNQISTSVPSTTPGGFSTVSINIDKGLYFKIKVDNPNDFNDLTSTDHVYSFGTSLPPLMIANQQDSNNPNLQAPPPQEISTEKYPVMHRYALAEDPIYYPSPQGPGGNANLLSVGSTTPGSNISNEYIPPATGPGDLRLTVEIVSSTEFKYTFEIPADGNSSWTTTNIPTGGGDVAIQYGNYTVLTLNFANATGWVAGDQYKISCRSDGHLAGNYFGGEGIPNTEGPALFDGTSEFMGAAIIPGPDFQGNYPNTNPEIDKAIEIGAVITIKITGNYCPSQANEIVFPPSEARYENIEEWFVESGAYELFKWSGGYSANATFELPLGPGPFGAETVTFRRGIMKPMINVGYSAISQGGTVFPTNGSAITNSGLTSATKNYPVKMIISGRAIKICEVQPTFMSIPPPYCGGPTFGARIEIKNNSGTVAQCETVPVISDADIYHETSRTYDVIDGVHKVLWRYQGFSGRSVPINAFNPTVGVYTALGQVTPGTTPSDIYPHTFQVGDEVEVHSTATPALAGTHTVIEVIDKYNVVINLAYPGGGTASAGQIGFHHDSLIEKDQTAVQAAQILINPTTNQNSTYNAYSFGNGLESDRIRDAFNLTHLDYSPRASTNIEGYEKQRKEASLTYSSTYRDKTSTNGLNEFNLSIVNFKNLDLEFGSIQKIHARNTDLLVLQEDKVSRVLYGKNLLSDAVGGGAVTTTPQVLGNQVSDTGEWGISFNPESFAEWGSTFYWADERRGAVLTIEGTSIVPISNLGMRNYFRNLMRDSSEEQKLGVFDPSTQTYVLATNEETSRPCSLLLSVYGRDYPSNTSDMVAIESKHGEDFRIVSNTSWTVGIAYSAGSGWVTNYPTSGFGNQNVFLQVANNTTSAVRTATITITFCSAKTVTYVVTQAPGEEIIVHPWVIGNKHEG